MRLRWCLAVAALLGGCESRNAAKTAVKPPAQTPIPKQPVTAVAANATVEPPLSAPQTTVVLPAPQPVNPEATVVVPPAPEPPPPAAKPVKTHTARPAPAKEEPPVEVGPPPPPTRPRVRPAESAAERRRIRADFDSRKREISSLLAKLSSRQLSDEERSSVERTQAFLDQANAALKKNDFQQADALSNRALLLARDLVRE